MSGDRKVMSKQLSSVCEGASYNEVYPSGHELEEDLTWSPKREPCAHSPVEGEEEKYEEDKEREGDEEEEEKDGEGEEGEDEEEGESDKGVKRRVTSRRYWL